MRFITTPTCRPIAVKRTAPAGAARRLRAAALSCVALAALLSVPRPVAAQYLPGGPYTAAGGRLTVAGEASVSYGTADDGYFNYSNYDTEVTRQLRADATAAFRVNPNLALLADLRFQLGIGEGNNWTVRPYALFARIRPWASRAFDVQVGLVPPVFGAFARRAYGTDNPLIGYPLAYQYLTSLRSDALPATADDLLAMRGRGWEPSYPLGNRSISSGLPLVDSLRYPAGVEVRVGDRPIEISAAVTTGSVSSPRLPGSGAGSQISAHAAVYPAVGLVLGASVSRGQYLEQTVATAASVPSAGAEPGEARDTQEAYGFDAEYSRGHWIVRTEGMWVRWHLPAVRAPFVSNPITAFGIDAEARYRLRPGLYAAARVGSLSFSDVTGTFGSAPWEAPVRRVEAGGGYSVLRNVVLKATYQYNWRDTTYFRSEGLFSAQMIVAF